MGKLHLYATSTAFIKGKPLLSLNADHRNLEKLRAISRQFALKGMEPSIAYVKNDLFCPIFEESDLDFFISRDIKITTRRTENQSSSVLL